MSLTALNRKWKAEISTEDGNVIVVSSPLTVEFQIRKNITGQINQSMFRIYNLNPNTRNQIGFDRFLTVDKDATLNKISSGGSYYIGFAFYAGYEMKSLSKIFEGNQQHAYTTKENTDIVTEISCVDGMYGVTNSVTNIDISTATNTNMVIETLVHTMKDLKAGFISSKPGVTLPSGYSFSGNTYNELCTLAKGDPQKPDSEAQCFIDNEKVNILGINEAFVNGGVVTIDATRILRFPRVGNTSIEIDVILDPNLRLGQLIAIASNYNTFINGQYKIVALSHSGIISGAKEGSCITTIQLFRPISKKLIPIYANE